VLARNKIEIGRDALEMQISVIWEQVLEIAPISITDNFFDLGGHSLQAARLIFEVNKSLGASLPISILFRASTVALLADALRQEQLSANSDSTVVPLRLGGPAPPLFLVHSVDGDLLVYRDLVQQLPAGTPVYGLRALHLSVERPFLTIEEMAEQYVRAILKFQPHGPYFVGGTCIAGLVALDIARQLISHGLEVGLVVLIDTHRPLFRPRRQWVYNVRAARGFFSYLAIADHKDRIASMFEAATSLGLRFKAKLWRLAYVSCERISLRPPAAMVDIEHARLLAGRRYRPQPYVGRVKLFRPRDRGTRYDLPADLGWSELISGGLEIIEVPGDHYTMLKSPNVKTLADELAEQDR
jgi:thioesterase domain-containing protein/acyl carrier protein